MNDASVILTKNTVLHKVRQLFMHLQWEMHEWSDPMQSHDAFAIPPKISRGENYLGLPYVILDYPRVFRDGNILAIRSMFWWGHYFSSTLHISGTYKQAVQSKVENSYQLLADEGYYVSVHEDQWLHQFEPEVYLPVAQLSKVEFDMQCRQFNHLKIGKTFPLQDDGNANEAMLESWKFLLEALIL